MKYRIELENWFGTDRYCVYRKPSWSIMPWEYLSVFPTIDEAEQFVDRCREHKR